MPASPTAERPNLLVILIDDLRYDDGEHRYILAPVGLKTGDRISIGADEGVVTELKVAEGESAPVGAV